MSRDDRTHFGDGGPSSDLTPKHLTKQEFARRVYRLMVAKGWTQSELARQADLPRDAVSTYVRGKTFPTPTSLKKLAEALGVEEVELLPNQALKAIDADIPSLSLQVSPSAPDQAWLRVNRLVTVTTATKIMELLNADKLPDGK